MANNCHIEYSSCLYMLVPLDDSCSIVAAVPSFVTAGFVEVNGEWEREDGTDYSAKNSNGRYCGPELRGPTIDKWINLSGSMCVVDWGILGMATGNPLTLDPDDNVVGYGEQVTPPAAPCEDPTGPKFALAVITRAAQGEGGGPCVSTEGEDTGFTTAKLHVYPLITDFKHTPPSHKDERRMVEFTARAYANPNIGRGPFNLYPGDYVPTEIPATLPHWEGFIPLSGLPSPACDPVAHPTPIPGVGASG